MKEIECSEKDLEIIISNLHLLGNYDIKARLEPSMKEMGDLVKLLHPKWNEKQRKIVTKIAFRDFTKEYVTGQKIAGTLFRYGNTKGEIMENIKEHLMNCEKCRLKYAKYLDEEAEKKLKWAQDEGLSDEKEKDKAQEMLNKGYKKLLKEADIFCFLIKNNVYKP